MDQQVVERFAPPLRRGDRDSQRLLGGLLAEVLAEPPGAQRRLDRDVFGGLRLGQRTALLVVHAAS